MVDERKKKNSFLGLSLKKEIGEYKINCYIHQYSFKNHIIDEKYINLSKLGI